MKQIGKHHVRTLIVLIGMLLATFALHAQEQQSMSQKVKLTLSGKNGSSFFTALEKAVNLPIEFTPEQAERIEKVTLTAQEEPFEILLKRVLEGTGLSYKLSQDKIQIITIGSAPNSIVVSGALYDDSGFPLIGAGVVGKAQQIMMVTDMDGKYSFTIPRNANVEVAFSSVGLNKETINFVGKKGKIVMDLIMKSSQVLEEVVVTGIYTRKMGSFTGSSISVDSKQLTTVGNQNILNSLTTIDPTIYSPTNLLSGSDPNSLPDISMRGVSSLSTSETGNLKGDFANNPNQPLFILDGFETSIQTIVDMDMNRVESITVLKDASAKAIYGSKAANGVIVIETKKLSGNEQRVTYNGTLSLEVPDLSSYNLTNSLEKIEVEKLDGVYDRSNNISGWETDRKLYNERRKRALEGLNTYWLAKPLRTGVGHKHNLSVELGDAQSLRSTIDFSYNDTKGVMKGSDRRNLSTTANIAYRKNNLIFRNSLTVLVNTGYDSPYGSFSQYARMNPYWEATDKNGNILRIAAHSDVEGKTANPMYDAVIGTLSSNKYYDITDNFYAEWRATKELKSVLRLGWNKKLSEINKFYPADHSRFINYSVDRADERGEYYLENGQSERLSGDLNLSYNKAFGVHSVFLNGGVFVAQNSGSNYSHTAVGFSNSEIADITFAKQYAKGSIPVGVSTIRRELSFLTSASYDYDNRYLLDATFRRGASSLYGANNRWANSWSVGTGWNVHYEPWMKFKALKLLKLRASIGVTGNQNFLTNTAVSTYMYYPGILYGGFTGAYLTNMPNPNLKWEQKLDKNIGFDMQIGGLNLNVDLYQADTKNMLTDLTIPGSTGFTIVKDNLGLVRNSGIEARLSYSIWRGRNGFVTVFGSASHNKNYIVSLSESLREYNEKMKENSTKGSFSGPVQLYQDGQSMTTIWAVKSAGIDPMRGVEVFVKKNGELTYTYDPADLVPVGDETPKVRGNAGINAEYKGFGFSMVLAYLAGGQSYNSTLVNKVENAPIRYNVDKRLAEGRWREAGQVTRYKKFESSVMTRPTSRFVQGKNELNISSISIYYNFPKRIYSALHAKYLKVALLMNDIATFSSIEVERGLAYPFARRFSCSVTATF